VSGGPCKDRDGAWTILLNKDPRAGPGPLAVKYTKGFEVLESLHDGTVEVLVPKASGKWVQTSTARANYFCVPGGVKHGPEPGAHRRSDTRGLPRTANPGTLIRAHGGRESRVRGRAYLGDVEAEMADLAVLDDVVLALQRN